MSLKPCLITTVFITYCLLLKKAAAFPYIQVHVQSIICGCKRGVLIFNFRQLVIFWFLDAVQKLVKDY